MAVLKMKKLRLIMLRKKRDELLFELICRGCVELIKPDVSGLEALEAEQSRVPELEQKLEQLSRAIALLERHSPAIKRLNLGRTVPEAHVLLDDTGLSFALKKAGDVLRLNEQMHFARFEQRRLKLLVEELKDWQGIEAPLHLSETESCKVLIGSLPLAVSAEKLSEELEHIDEKSELFIIKEDKKLKYMGLLCMKERSEEMAAVLKAKGFVPAPRTDSPGSAMQCSSDSLSRIQEHSREEEHVKKLLSEETIHLEALYLAYDRVNVKLALARAEEKMYGTEQALLVAGWLPEKHEAQLCELFDAYGCAYDIAEPTAEEKAEVPRLTERADEKRDSTRAVKAGFRRGRVFEPLVIKTKYYKLAE